LKEARDRIRDDLRGLVRGEMLFEPVARSPFRYDSGLDEVDPLGVVFPRSEDDLVALTRYASERGLWLHPRGAGTGSGGGCLGSGLVVDLSRHFRQFRIEGHTAIAQAGVVLDSLLGHLASVERRLAVSPLRREAATIAGLVALDAEGPRSLRYGSIAEHVQALRGVLPTGERVQLAPTQPLPHDIEPFTAIDTLVRRLDVLRAWHLDLIERHARGRLRAAHEYRLDALISPDCINLPRLLAGSRGSLTIVTEVTLALVPIPRECSVIIAPYARIADAADAVALCLTSSPVCCDLLDVRTLSVAREAFPLLHEAIPETPQAFLLVGFEGDHSGDVADHARRLADRLSRQTQTFLDPIEIHDTREANRLIDFRTHVDRRMLRSPGSRPPVDLLDELRVPLDNLPGFLVRLQNLFTEASATALIDAHAGLGSVRARPFLDFADPADRERIDPLANAIRALALECGGTASPGFGPNSATWVKRFADQRLHLNREIKNAFDPRGILNPDKIAREETGTSQYQRRTVPTVTQSIATIETSQAGSMILDWPDRSRADHLGACNNCGACRSQEVDLRMCPVFRASHHEAATPRAHVNLLRQVASGSLDPRLWAAEEFREHAELCVHCKLCESECPAEIDVSALMLEAKAAYVANHGQTQEDWMLSRIELWAAWASRFPRLYNLLTQSRPSRWFLQRAFGLSQHRLLPLARRRSFVRRAARLGLTRPRPHLPGPRVAYFLDLFANHFDQELAQATVDVLQHLGVNVYVPRAQSGSGMPALVTGDVDRARDLVDANLNALGNAVRDGYVVVCSEPTALLMLKKEAIRLTDDLDAQLVARHAMDVGQYLVGLLKRPGVPQPHLPLNVRVGYHQPCHLRALHVGTPGLELLGCIPGLEVRFIDRGCSGMAGIFGLSARNLRTSLRAGRGLLRDLKKSYLDLGATECSACRMQMEQGGRKRTIHPLKLLALSYGLNSAIRRHLTDPKPRRSLS
jgi:Fe-S oxidoreductase/FAD/FMN-containing dehydrogenase